MKAITIPQPYAQLIAMGIIPFHAETWTDEYRGPIAIHAASDKDSRSHTTAQAPEFHDALAKKGITFDDLPFGKVIATGELIEIHDAIELAHDVSRFERKTMGGKPHTHPYVFEYSGMGMLAEPVPHRDAKGIWEWKEKAPEPEAEAVAETAETAAPAPAATKKPKKD